MEASEKKIGEAYGIKETLEILDLIGLVAEKLFMARLTGGLSKLELMRYALSEEFRHELSNAIEGSSDAPKEWGDISGSELVTILQHVLTIVGRIATNRLAA
jgi:hypothetical protein